MNTWWALYFGAGVLVFFLLRAVSRRARVNVTRHDRIWTFWIWDPEGWILGVLLWPLVALAVVFWIVAEVAHRNTLRRVVEIEAKQRQQLRENPYRALSLDELLSAVESARKRERSEE